MKNITIIGGGASGTLLAVNLLKYADNELLTINLVEKRIETGRGVAYSTISGVHLLNVPAFKMGAFPDDVEDFYKWLQTKKLPYDDHAFVPRKIYGEYLSDTLTAAVESRPDSAQINIINDEAIDIDGSNVILQSGQSLPSDQIILAFGNSLPPHPSVADQKFTAAPKYFQDQWSPAVYDEIKADDSFLIIGTGLSMVDLAMHYHAAGHRGKINALSTRGLLPAVHSLGHSYPSFYEELKGMTRITDLFKAVRRHFKKAEDEGLNWRGVIDSLRPHTSQIWLDLPTSEKRYFMQHLSRYWNVARHRVPMQAAEILDEMQADGRLDILKGRLKTIAAKDGRFEITFSSDGTDKTITADAIINCIGSESNFERLDSTLVRNLIDKGMIQNDSLSLGLDATPAGRLIGRDGKTSEHLWTMGTALKGILWESTAMPEIRVQAKALALRLLDKG